jgi:hypothetical protein
LQLLLGDHLHLLEFINQSISDSVHKLFDVFFEDTEKQVWRYLEIPLLQSLSQAQELLEVLRQFMVIVDTIQTVFDIRLDLFIILNELFHAKIANVF